MVIKSSFLLLGFLLLIFVVGCESGDSPLTSQGGTKTVADRDRQLEFLAQKLPDEISADDILLIDLDEEITYAKERGLEPLNPSDTSLARFESSTSSKRPTLNQTVEVDGEIASEGKSVAFHRVPTRLGTSSQPFSRIQASLSLPPEVYSEENQFDWLNETKGEAAFAYLGAQTTDPVVTLDIGLTTNRTGPHMPGEWYGFIFSDTSGFRHLPTFPAGGIPSGTALQVSMTVLDDVDPDQPGDQIGAVFTALGVSPFAYIASGREVEGLRPDGIDQSVRYVTSLVSKMDDASMFDTVWANVQIGTQPNMQLFSSAEVGVSGADGSPVDTLEIKNGKIRNDSPYHAETVDLDVRKAAALIIDDTGSMGGELAGVKIVLDAFIVSGLGKNVASWSLVSFKDSVNSFGTTEDKDVIRSWVGGLFPSGGGNCPESSLQALERGRQLLTDEERSRQMILVTDASPNAGDIDGLIADLRADGIVVHTLLTGDCVSGPVEGVRAQTTGPLSARVVFSRISAETGGQYFYLPGARQEDFQAALTEIFEAVANEPSDTEPPVLTLTADPTILWPPNHKMVEIDVEAVAMDNADPNPQVEFVEVQVNEPDDIQGSGNTQGDVEISDGRLFVRAERSGTGQRRVYSIIYKATDAAGNSTHETVEVVVPHDKSKK